MLLVFVVRTIRNHGLIDGKVGDRLYLCDELMEQKSKYETDTRTISSLVNSLHADGDVVVKYIVNSTDYYRYARRYLDLVTKYEIMAFALRLSQLQAIQQKRDTKRSQAAAFMVRGASYIHRHSTQQTGHP